MIVRSAFIFFLLLIFLISQLSIAQCPTPDFDIPTTACIDQNIRTINNSTNATSYTWDFCADDLSIIPKAEIVLNENDFFRARTIKIINENSNWYGFAVSQTSNNLIMLNFGQNLSNTPTYEDLGNPNGLLQGAFDLDAINIDGKWNLIIANTNGGNLINIEFKDGIENNNPTITDLGDFGVVTNPSHVLSLHDQGNYYLFVSNSGQLIKIKFDNSLSEANPITEVTTVSGSSTLRGFSILKSCDTWVGILLSYNNRLYSFNYGDKLENTPTIKQLNTSGMGFSFPANIGLVHEGHNYYGFVQGALGVFHRLDFTGDIIDFNFTATQLSIPEFTSNDNFALDIVKDKSSLYLFNFNLSQRNLVRVDFQNNCSASSAVSNVENPIFSYDTPGIYNITLSSIDQNGNNESITKQIEVTNNIAPSVYFETGTNLCITDPISFTGASSETINTWNWNFGDGNTATGQNTEFTFTSPGTYEVILEVEGANGCGNRIKKSITVYEPLPVTFSSSAQGAICSQKPTLFTNTTDSPPIATYTWDFGDGTTSTEENPEHVYQSAGDYTVRLSVAFAGCESFAEQTITVNPGPEVSFSTIDNCLGQSISFNNTSSGDFISSYLWDFGDGTTSTQENPEYTFETAGVKNVSLTAFTTNGCDYTIQQNIEVFPVAVVDFEVEIACATQPVQFNEQVFLELSNVTDYLWDFGIAGRTDDISTFANPQFTFPEAGTYQVSLQVTTADGCVSNKQKTVMVNPVPEPLFNYTPKCVGNSITFNGNSNEEVASQYWELSNSKGEVVSVGANENFTYIFLNIGNYTLRYRQQNQQLCSNEYEETIRILPNPVPSFAVSQLCLGSSITFQNTTDLQGNTLEAYNWLIDGELVSNDENVEFTFEEAGNYTIILQAITASGCIETTSQTITIEPIPSVNFTLEQLVGAYPFSVNTKVDSVAGFSYKWSINNQVVSTTSVLNEVLETAGTYFINLLVTNPEGCTVTSSQQVRVRAPELDFSLANLRIVPSDDFTEFVVSITNKGSIIPQEVDLIVDFGAYSITERVDRTINPESTINYALNTKLSQNQLKRLSRICLSASIKSNILSEEKKSDNRVCNNLESTFKIMDLYPNPSTTQLTIPLIIPEKGNILVNLEQADGKQNRQYSYNLEDGYNEITLERGNLKAGVYFVRISYQGKEEMKKVVFR